MTEYAAATGKVRVTPWQPSVRERIGEAWRGRALFPLLARRMVPTYRGRILGRAWIFVRPFMQVFGFALVFGGVFHATAPDGIPYILFMLLGVQAFRFFEFSVLFATLSSRMVKRQTRSLRIPLLLVPLAASSRALMELLIYWVFTAALLVYYYATSGHFYLEISLKLLVGLGGLLLCLVYALAIGLFTSVVYPRAMDIRYLVRYGMQFWLVITPVLYSLDSLPHRYQTLAQLNPMTPLVGMVQYGFLDAGELHAWSIAWALGAIVVTGLVGLWFFNRLATQWIGIYTLDDEDDEDEGDLI
jgi:ABC-type polysaccharide/polyol phosphate export permease